MVEQIFTLPIMSTAIDSSDLGSQLPEDAATSAIDRPTSTEPESVPLESAAAAIDTTPLTPAPSYVKLAMRNMVRKRGLSLYHFTLTALGLLAVLVGLSYVTR